MKVKDLITELQKAPQDAEAVFYDHKTNQFLDLKHVEGGRNSGRVLCVVGEVTMQVKCGVRAASKAGSDVKTAFDELRRLFG